MIGGSARIQIAVCAQQWDYVMSCCVESMRYPWISAEIEDFFLQYRRIDISL
jgi:hypothetical protein